MFDIGWTELFVVAIVALFVVGPKDLPGMLRTVGKTVGNLRRMAGDFQRQFNDALKEAELDEVRKAASFKPLEEARKSAMAFQDSVNNSIRDIDAKPGEATSEEQNADTGPVASGQTAPGSAAPAKPKPAATPKTGTAAKGKPAATSGTAPGAAASGGKPARAPAKKPAAGKPAASKPAKPATAGTAKTA
ncbi:MAG: Sec-independent protein translocase protein TatB, partial [Pseudomonadota bacterium]|nr:Sec-independent protein translocase protein TatB [Pseudomonadota bacterium]